jgi:3-oxoacyl-[acyl-carrier protein] reductase
VKNRENSKVAVITGGSRGIGLGIARKLGGEGFDLVIIGKREESQVESLSELRKLGRKVLYCQGDISLTESIEAIVQKIHAHFSQVNLLVNNAGIAPRTRMDLLQTTEASYHDVMNTNLTGPFFQAVSAHSDFQSEIPLFYQ